MSRKDYRNLETFKQDIKFGTLLEQFWWSVYLNELKGQGIEIVKWRNNGVDNSGNYVEKSSGAADFFLVTRVDGVIKEQFLEIKFAPKNDKISLKVRDLQNYITQGAEILLFVNSGPSDLRKPKDYNFDLHIDRIRECLQDIVYTVISCEQIKELLKLPAVQARHMGNKWTIVLEDRELFRWKKIRYANL